MLRKKHKVISYKLLPTRLPIWPTIITWLVMDRLQPAEWIWGAVIVFWLLAWLGAIVELRSEEHVTRVQDLLEDPTDEAPP